MRKMLAVLCCTSLFVGAALAGTQPFLSEVFFNPPGTDGGQEYIELGGPAGFGLTGYYVLVIEGDGTGGGVVDQVLDLSGQSLGTNGLFLRRDAATVLSPAPAPATNVQVLDFSPDIENGTNTYVLGFGTPPAVATDLDANNDGALDGPLAGFTVVDAVSFAETAGVDEFEYADDLGGTALGFVGHTPHALYRLIDCNTGRPIASGSWAGGQVTGASPGPYNWSPTSNFGWAGIGIGDPSALTLDPGNANYQVGCSGRCCLADGFCVVTTAADCATQSGTYGGDNTICNLGDCPSNRFGACCFPNGSCMEGQSPGDCDAQGGTYAGDNVTCAQANCPQPTGACCNAGMCTTQTRADCVAGGGFYVGDNVACGPTNPCPIPAPAVQGCDVAVGYSSAGPGAVHLARGGAFVGAWTGADFLQSVEFDNRTGPFAHSPNGNLLALNFGAAGGTPGSSPSCVDPLRPQEGGGLWNLSTDGSDTLELIYRFNTLLGGIDCTRTGGLSVSPNNSRIAVWGQDTGSLYVLDYNAGATPGTGTGASITGAAEFNFWGNTGITQGTAWLDDDTVVGAVYGVGNTLDVQTLDVPSGVISVLINIPATAATGSRFVEVEYNPTIAPYLFVLQSAFDSGTSTSQSLLSVIDIQGPNFVRSIDLSMSLQTSREMALCTDRNLYLGQFAGSTAPLPRVYVDVLDLDTDNDGDVDAADIAALADNSSTDYFSLNPGISSSFNGMDVALGSADPCAGHVVGDANGDGVVNNFDIDAFVLALTDETAYVNTFCGGDPACRVCRCDTNGDGLANNFDIDSFVACVVNNGCP
ncbi:MAG: hypothetical protein AB7Q17_11075 [Phycisphaerae bacterium]